ncbi:hypothetical protein M9458_053153, partial [Cirrhinus mrigala]
WSNDKGWRTKRLSHRMRKALCYETHSFQLLPPSEDSLFLPRPKRTRSGAKFKLIVQMNFCHCALKGCTEPSDQCSAFHVRCESRPNALYNVEVYNIEVYPVRL